MLRKLFFLLVIFLLVGNLYAGHKQIDLSKSDKSLVVLENYSGKPDQTGIFEAYELQVPEFRRGVYYRGPWWPYGGNRVFGEVITKAEVPEGGLFLLLELTDGTYLAVLPLCGNKAYSWFSSENKKFILKFGTRGTAKIQGDMPLVSWAKANGAYHACYLAWEQACECEQIKGWMKLREQKTYPEVFKYLGWCSWEGYRKNITSEKLVEEFKGLQYASVPIRYFLVDDGHFDADTLAPLADKFPNGYKPLTDIRNNKEIRWVGMWHALVGNNKAMPKGSPPSLQGSMMLGENGRMVPKPDLESMEKFLNLLFSHSVSDCIDFVKVDFYGILMPTWAGSEISGLAKLNFPASNIAAVANPTEATVNFARIYQTMVEKKFKGLMNCNWQIPPFIFNSGDSVVGRCSEDYRLGSLPRAKSHLYGSYNTIPWIGQIAWGDHDMFHSSDKVAGRMMAVSKAVSGGPVYLSDKHSEIVSENVMPLCYEDGLLVRPLAPAAPLPEDLFHSKDDKDLYCVMAPLKNKTAVFVLYNLTGDLKSNRQELSGKISCQDYRSASGMIQPYRGKWDIPEEGLVVFDHYNQKAEKLNNVFDVMIKGFGDRLLQVSPIENGWSVIGRIDKYLSAATVENISSTKAQLKFRLHESGPFGIWLSKGVPVAKGIEFLEKGNGFFVANLPVKATSVEIVVRRK